jgi:hypothetical protein
MVHSQKRVSHLLEISRKSSLIYDNTYTTNISYIGIYHMYICIYSYALIVGAWLEIILFGIFWQLEGWGHGSIDCIIQLTHPPLFTFPAWRESTLNWKRDYIGWELSYYSRGRGSDVWDCHWKEDLLLDGRLDSRSWWLGSSFTGNSEFPM